METFVGPGQSPDEKKKELYLKQKELLDQFLANGAISREQYETSLKGLTEKMHMEGVLNGPRE